jgi:hypothetical protein
MEAQRQQAEQMALAQTNQYTELYRYLSLSRPPASLAPKPEPPKPEPPDPAEARFSKLQLD